MTDTPAHTPLPWVIDPTYPSEVQTSQLESITLCWHEQAAGQEITVTGVLPCSLSESAANAVFIVRACNSHYQLVEAAKAIMPTNLNLADWLPDDATIPLDVPVSELRALAAALSQAGGASE